MTRDELIEQLATVAHRSTWSAPEIAAAVRRLRHPETDATAVLAMLVETLAMRADRFGDEVGRAIETSGLPTVRL
jgi:hypothetical protein